MDSVHSHLTFGVRNWNTQNRQSSCILGTYLFLEIMNRRVFMYELNTVYSE